MEVAIAMEIVAAVVLFLYGIEHLSRELQRLAASRMRETLQKIASNKWAAAGVGAAVTAAIQSSTATNAVTISLVDAGVLSFMQSLAVIAGANVGTTVTTQLIALKITFLAPFLIICGFALSLFGNKRKLVGKSIFYLGFLLLAISLLSTAVEPLENDAALSRMMANFQNPFLALLAGFFITQITQSSAATIAVAIVLGNAGILGLEQAIPIILGANVGTTTTTLFASLRLGVFSKRAAVAHTLVNIIGAAILFPFMAPFASFVSAIGGDMGHMIANAHTLFNIVAAAFFLLFIGAVARACEWIVPSKEKELLFKAEYINGVPEHVEDGVNAVKKELERQVNFVRDSFYISYGMVRKSDAADLPKAMKIEGLIDYLNGKISLFLVDLSKKDLTPYQSERIILLARIANEIEEIGKVSEDFAKLAQRLEEKNEVVLPEVKEEMDQIKKSFDKSMDLLLAKMWEMDKKTFRSLSRRRISTDRLIQEAYKRQIKRFADNQISALTSTTFVDEASSIEKANSALLRVARMLLKLKQLESAEAARGKA